MVFNNERMVDIVASVRCWYKVGMRRRPHFHQLPTWAQRIFAICVVTPNTKYIFFGGGGGVGGGVQILIYIETYITCDFSGGGGGGGGVRTTYPSLDSRMDKK